MPDLPTTELEYYVAPASRQRRLTVLFRFLLALPHLVVLEFVNIAAGVCVFLGWFVAIFTGRNPYFRFVAGVLRWNLRVGAYSALLTDQYPPFSLDDDQSYPVRIGIEEGSLGRLKVFFRVLLSIPAQILLTLVSFGLTPFYLVGWVVTLVAGRLPRTLHDAFAAMLRFQGRLQAYTCLIQGKYPGGLFGDATFARTATAASSSTAAVDLAAKYGGSATTSTLGVAASPTSENDPATEPTGSAPTLPWYYERSEISSPSPPSSSGFSWALVLSAGARRLLVVAIVLGLVLVPLFVVAEHAAFRDAATNLDESIWATSYRSDVQQLIRADRVAEGQVGRSPTVWALVDDACLNAKAKLSEFATIPQYPDAGPNDLLLKGYAYMAGATTDCLNNAVPTKSPAALSAVMATYRVSRQDLSSFLDAVPNH